MSKKRLRLFAPSKMLGLLLLAFTFAGISSLSVQSVDAPEVSFDGLHTRGVVNDQHNAALAALLPTPERIDERRNQQQQERQLQ